MQVTVTITKTSVFFITNKRCICISFLCCLYASVCLVSKYLHTPKHRWSPVFIHFCQSVVHSRAVLLRWHHFLPLPQLSCAGFLKTWLPSLMLVGVILTAVLALNLRWPGVTEGLSGRVHRVTTSPTPLPSKPWSPNDLLGHGRCFFLFCWTFVFSSVPDTTQYSPLVLF
jgi:hypothetical protein